MLDECNANQITLARARQPCDSWPSMTDKLMDELVSAKCNDLYSITKKNLLLLGCL